MLIPALLIVLLGELGGAVARGRHDLLVVISAAAVIAITATAGTLLAPILTPPARTLLVGVTLVFASVGQLRTRIADIPPALAIWSSSVPFSLFALSLYAASPYAAAVGGVLGLAAAIAIGGRSAIRLRRAAAALLGVAGLIVSLLGLRLL